MKILVAGNGMIGSNVVRILLANGHAVWTADLTDGEDLRFPEVCARVVKNADRVFHLADRTVGVGYSSKHHGQMMTDSLLVSLNLLKASDEAGVKDFIYVSSSCVYADRTDWPVREVECDDRLPPEMANEGYGWAKRIAEKQCEYYAHEYGMRTVIARPANVYGPSYNWNRPVDEMHVVPALISKMLRGDKEITVWGDGKQTRTLQYESDAAELIVALADAGESGQAYNLGGHEVSICEIASRLAELESWTGKLNFHVFSGTQGPTRKAHNTSKITKLIGPITNKPLTEGLAATLARAIMVC